MKSNRNTMHLARLLLGTTLAALGSNAMATIADSALTTSVMPATDLTNLVLFYRYQDPTAAPVGWLPPPSGLAWISLPDAPASTTTTTATASPMVWQGQMLLPIPNLEADPLCSTEPSACYSPYAILGVYDPDGPEDFGVAITTEAGVALVGDYTAIFGSDLKEPSVIDGLQNQNLQRTITLGDGSTELSPDPRTTLGALAFGPFLDTASFASFFMAALDVGFPRAIAPELDETGDIWLFSDAQPGGSALAQVVAVPEPSTVMLLASGLFGMLLIALRRTARVQLA